MSRKSGRRSCCGKVRYKDEIGAKLALAKIWSEDTFGHREQRAYYHPRCKGWHLTSMALVPAGGDPR